MDVGPIGAQRPEGGSPRRKKVVSDLDLRISSAFKGAFSPLSRTSPESITISCDSHSDGSPASRGVSPAELDNLALPGEGRLGLGYKSANLLRLQGILRSVGADVPPFLPLGHQEMLDHISKVYPLLSEDYHKFLDTLGAPPTLNDIGRDILAHIRGGIELAFSGENQFKSSQLVEWVSSRSSEYIAVRSTGKEDSDKISNAGGNLSNPFVSRNLSDISKNIGAVIASYFSEKSISQRISSDDSSLIEDRDPFVPVLLQEAIAERTQGITDEKMIPRSGVLFVRVGSMEVSETSVGLGHNEGVVTSQVMTDTVRFSKDGTISQVVRNKSTRFRGHVDKFGDVSCISVRCDKSIATKPALSDEDAEMLRDIVLALATGYQKNMDFEYTIQQNLTSGYQVRPLIVPPAENPASYLEPSEGDIHCETLTNGGCYVREIASSENIIVSETITDAYNSYKKLTKDQRVLVQGIIIKKTAPRTSHEAVFFISKGLPILITSEMILTLPYKLDPQQGLISKGENIHEGYICYPIPLQYSMRASPLIEMMDVPERGEEIRIGLRALQERMGPSLDDPIRNISELKKCHNKVKSADLEERRGAISRIANFVHELSKQKDITPKTRVELIMILENILDIRESAATSLPLYTARLIEACLFQTGEGIIGGFSITRSLGAIRSQRVGIEELMGFHSEETLQDILFVKMGRQLLQPESAEIWSQVLVQLSRIPLAERNRVKSLFYLVDSMGSATEFMNVTVLALLKKHGTNTPALFSELSELAEKLKPTLVKAHKLHHFASDLKASTSAWGNSEYIRKNLSRLTQRLHDIRFCQGKGGIANVYRHATPEARLILIQAMREVVTAYDEVIKACTGSTEYKSHVAQANDLLKLLGPYREMMLVIEEVGEVVHAAGYDAESYTLPESLGTISEEEAETLKEISPDFDVSKVVASEVIRYTEIQPVPAITLEEKFTLFHKTMEKNLSCLAVQSGFSKQILPFELQSYIDILKAGQIFSQEQLVSININENLVAIEFMIPLRDHGAKLILNYNKDKKSVAFDLSIYGGNEWNRWEAIKDFANRGSSYFGIDLESVDINDTGVSLKLGATPLLGDFDALSASSLIEGFLTISFSPIFSILKLIPPRFQTHELVMQEVLANPWNLQFVPKYLINKELVDTAMKISPLSFEFVPNHLQTEEMAIVALSEDPQLLGLVRRDLMTKKVIYTALNQDRGVIDFVPLELQTPDMIVQAAEASSWPRWMAAVGGVFKRFRSGRRR